MSTTTRGGAWLGALSVGCALLTSCGNGGPKTGTNTNWLQACDADADCDTGAHCLCGTCTITCETPANCTKTHGSCSASLAAAAQCGAVGANPLCLASCSSDKDCATGQLCIAQSCVQVTIATTCSAEPSALACATFDTDSLDGWVPAVDAAATLDVTASTVFDGAGSLRSVWPGRAIVEQSFDPVLSGSLYGRFWLRLGATGPTVHVAQLDGDSGDTALRLVIDGTNAWVETTNGVVSGQAVTLSASQWHCVRFAVELSDTDGTLRVWLDEALMVDAQGQDTLPVAGVTGLQVGVGWADGATALYIDNVLLSTKSVSCI